MNILFVLSWEDFPTDMQTREDFASQVARAARGVQRGFSPGLLRSAGFGRETRQWMRASSQDMSAALLQHQRVLVSYGPDSIRRCAESLAVAVLASINHDVEPFRVGASTAGKVRWLRRNLPRIVGCSIVVSLGLSLGYLFPGLNGDQLLQLRILLVGTAFLSLLSPSEGSKATLDVIAKTKLS
jgi:hypothetical protein